VIEPDDGRPDGWSHREFAAALGRAVGRRAVALATPRPLLRIGAAVDRLVRRDKAKLTPDRAAYFCHPDWVVSASSAPAEVVWRPEVATEQGLAQTADWYRAKGWLCLYPFVRREAQDIARLAIQRRADGIQRRKSHGARLSGLEDGKVGKRDVDPLSQLAQRHPAIVKDIIELDDDRHVRSSPQDPRA
jgi:hypothetical protein